MTHTNDEARVTTPPFAVVEVVFQHSALLIIPTNTSYLPKYPRNHHTVITCHITAPSPLHVLSYPSPKSPNPDKTYPLVQSPSSTTRQHAVLKLSICQGQRMCRSRAQGRSCSADATSEAGR